MSEIHITREHHLGLERAGRLARHWAERAGQEFGMECVYEEGEASDRVVFTRDGVRGALTVDAAGFALDAKLGLLYAAMKRRIESEIVRKLDELIAREEAKPAKKHAAVKKKAKT